MTIKREYSFTDAKMAIFTWYGAEIETTDLGVSLS
jgi:hypothetical protein